MIKLIFISMLCLNMLACTEESQNRKEDYLKKKLSNQSKTVNEMDEKLTKAVLISNKIIEKEKRSLLKDANIIGSNELLISLIEYGYIPKNNQRSEESFIKKGDSFVVEYQKANSVLCYIQLARKMQAIMYETGEGPEQIEIIDKTGNVKSTTIGLNESFKEQSNSERIKEIQEIPGLTMIDLISASEGIAIKAYGRINKNLAYSEKQGIVVVSIPLDSNFANEIKEITDKEVAIYNKGQYMTGTFINTDFIKKGEEEIFNKFKECNLEGVTRDKYGKEMPEILFRERNISFESLDNEGNEIRDKDGNILMETKEYKFAYSPLRNNKGYKIGMIALAIEIK